MQYKIPVQIENEDPIILGLSIRQLIIIMIGGGISYSIFKNLALTTSAEVALIPSGAIFIIAVIIAIFKQYEMTFTPFFLSLLRLSINAKRRYWMQGTDSFQPLDIGYVSTGGIKQTENIDFQSKMDKIEELNSKIDKI
ncbi:MAG: PrgI family protein [Candidatus Peribacteria bacterium]|nr:MAG: PrgI family protein [Candidatus Peribacteria bacterium]